MCIQKLEEAKQHRIVYTQLRSEEKNQQQHKMNGSECTQYTK